MKKVKLKVKKGDNVLIIAGKDRGKTGKVLKVLPSKMRVIVEGINFIKKHTRPNPQKNIKGGVLEKEAPIHVSNVKIICPDCGKAVRVGRKKVGPKEVMRVCKKCESVFP